MTKPPEPPSASSSTEPEITGPAPRSDRNSKGQFLPGNSGLPGRPRIQGEWTDLWQAIRKVEKAKKKNLFEYFVERAFSEDRVLIALIRKLLPTRIEGRITHEEVERVVIQIVAAVASHVPEPERLRKIADDVTRIASLSSGSGSPRS